MSADEFNPNGYQNEDLEVASLKVNKNINDVEQTPK